MYITARLAASQPVPARPGTSCLLLCAFTLQLPVYVRGWVRRGICFSLWFFFPFSQVVYHQAMPWLHADCLVWVGLRNAGEFVPAWPGRRLLPARAGGDAGRLGQRCTTAKASPGLCSSPCTKKTEQKIEAQGLTAQPAKKLLQKLILPSERWTAAAPGGEEKLPAGVGPVAAAARS